jgi:hypothetical protein
MNIFVSYSAADNDLVAAIVALLSASHRAFVYCDADAIRSSGRWQQEVADAIGEADVMLLFWCHHAHTSYEVRKEFALALDRNKDIVLLLVDATPLPAKLAGRRCIDFRARLGAIHEGAPEESAADRREAQEYADRLIAGDIARPYEDLLIMGLAREIETELAARLGTQ